LLPWGAKSRRDRPAKIRLHELAVAGARVSEVYVEKTGIVAATRFRLGGDI